MSGGALDYRFGHVNDLAEAIRDRIVREPYVDEWGYEHAAQPAQVVAAFERAALLCDIAAKAAHDVEWLLSGDTGDESFIQDSLEWTPDRVAAILTGQASVRDSEVNHRVLRAVWGVVNGWTKERWNYAASRWNEPPDEATAARWACADEVKNLLSVHDIQNLDDIRPLHSVLTDLVYLAHRWRRGADPVKAECGEAISKAMRAARGSDGNEEPV